MDVEAEKITPYGDMESKTGQVRQMFDSIAPAYDFMNRAMTMGIDKWWRRVAVKMLAKSLPKTILDIATGTGDLALLLHRKLCPEKIVGLDLSEGMLKIAREKAAKAGADIEFEQGDSLAMRFADNSFDAITVAYGVRNFEHLEQGYREMHRVLRPGGVLVVIELATPVNPIVRPLYNLYTRYIIPWAGRSISKDRRAYSYLPESIAAVPQRDSMLQLMRNAGFGECSYKAMTFGTCIIYMASK
ncbi:MAG: bifunctional demethylmenaquinone methyltransferase/2-methoxy-6-polyprenyl-1,4-benzoquinol methylase UbiE [Muribaculaceae bacterium]